MKLKNTLTIAAFILSVATIFAQSSSDNLTINGYRYPNPTVSNLLDWIGLSTMDWEAEMKKFDFSDRGIESGCVYYGSGASLDNAVFSISKCPGNIMTVTWIDDSRKGITKLDGLINEIEPYYNRGDEDGNAIYMFKHNDFAYHCTVVRDGAYEIVIIKRYSLDN